MNRREKREARQPDKKIPRSHGKSRQGFGERGRKTRPIERSRPRGDWLRPKALPSFFDLWLRSTFNAQPPDVASWASLPICLHLSTRNPQVQNVLSASGPSGDEECACVPIAQTAPRRAMQKGV